MADLALIFHWQPAVMDAMDIAELMRWRALAVQRHNAMQGAEP